MTSANEVSILAYFSPGLYGRSLPEQQACTILCAHVITAKASPASWKTVGCDFLMTAHDRITKHHRHVPS